MYLELEDTRRPDFPAICTCPTLIVMGYPCGQFLRRCQASGEPVPLSAIRRHWCYEPLRVDPPQSLTQPVIRAPQTRLQRRQVDDASSCDENVEDNVPIISHEAGREGTIGDMSSTQEEEAMEAEGQPPVAELAASPSQRRTRLSGQYVLSSFV